MRYIFPITYFNAKEKNLPDDVDFERMIAAENVKKAMVVLQDTIYASIISEDSSKNIEEILEKEEMLFKKDLMRIGIPEEIIDFLFLKKSFFKISLFLKKKIFGADYPFVDEMTIETKYKDIIKELEKCSFQTSMEIDDKTNQVFFEQMEKVAGKLKDKELKNFFKDYRNAFKNEKKSDIVEKLKKIEETFIEKNKWKINGVSPIFSFFLKKRIAQKKLRAILRAKQIELGASEINKLIESLPALI